MNEFNAEFDGSDYKSKHDKNRLKGQILRVFNAVKLGGWFTLDELHHITNDPHASISAQLRHLRKEKFGSYNIEKRPRGDRSNGLWEYRLWGSFRRKENGS